MLNGERTRLALIVLATLISLWLAACIGLAIIAGGCGLQIVLPWYDAGYNVCK